MLRAHISNIVGSNPDIIFGLMPILCSISGSISCNILGSIPYDAKPLDPFQLASLNQFLPNQVILDSLDPVSAAADVEGCEDDADVLESIPSVFKLIPID